MGFCCRNTDSITRLGTAILSLLAVSTALSQTPVLKTRTKEQLEERSTAVHRITLNLQVTDASGNAVSDLRPDEVTLYDNHQARRISGFHPVDGEAMNDATEVLILLDAVNTPAQALAEEKDAIFRYFASNRGPFPFPIAFAVWFNGHISATPASKDRNQIGRAFVKLTKNVHSNACGENQPPMQQKVAVSKRAVPVDAATCRAVHFKDSIAALDGIAQEQLAMGGRTLLLWMGSGWPKLSDADLQRMTPKQKRDYASNFVSVLHDLRAAQITLYSLAPPSNKSEQASVEPPHRSTDGFPKLAVDEFARRTGGRVIDASADLVADLRACVHDADWYYAVSFNAPPAQNGAGELHTLEVKVSRPDVNVRTMSSYYSEPQ